MIKKITYSRIFLTAVLAMFIFTLSSQIAFAGCDKSYFKISYRKVGLSGYGNNNLDWNNDGRPDFWKTELDPNTNTYNIKVFLHNGNGDWEFDNPTIFRTDSNQNPLFPNLWDFDSDGDMDFIVTVGFGIERIYRNNGNNTFTGLALISFPGENLTGGFGYFDVNDDNYLDRVTIVGVPNQGHSFGYNPANPDGTFGSRVDIYTGTATLGSPSMVIGDFTGDGRIDIAPQFSQQGGRVTRVFKNNGNGTFTLGDESPAFRYGKIVEDFNNDGKMDILGSYYSQGSPEGRQLFILYSNGDGTFTKTDLPVYHPDNPTEDQVADFNGDNHPDIIATDDGDRNGSGKPFYSIYLNDGAGNFSRTDYDRLLSLRQYIFFDHDGDNKDDLYDGGVINNFGELVELVKQNICQPFGQTKAAEFNGTANADLVLWNSNAGKWNSINSVWSSSDNLDSKEISWGSGALGDVPALGDYDGDRISDYTVYRNSTGEWYILRSSDSSWMVVKFGVPGDIPVPSDYDGGGKSDIAVFRPSDGNWYILYTETQQFYATHFGIEGDKPVPEDFDGDGKTDVAVFRPAEGNWYYLKSSDQNFVAIHWGVETDIPLPADYDGDGKADITVYRGGDWYFLRSLDDSFALIKWGTDGDVPMPFYRRDDFAQLVVYRPLTRIWYNNNYPSSGIYFGAEQSVPVRFGLPND